MARIWEDQPKRRSPADSGNNGTPIGRFVKKLLTPKPKKNKGGKGK